MALEANKIKQERQDSSLGAIAPGEVPFLEKLISKLETFTYMVNKLTHVISMVILMGMMFLTFGDVVGRYFFNKPITGAYEVTALALAIMVFYSIGIAQLKSNHIEIDVITNLFPIKVQESLNVLKYAVFFIILILTTWQLLEYTKRLFISKELSGDIAIPLYIFTSLSAIGICFFALTFLLDFCKSLLKVVQKK